MLGQRVPTGSYPYRIQATSLNANAAVSIPSIFGTNSNFVQYPGNYPGLVALPAAQQTGTVTIINRESSPYGAGWTVIQDERLVFDPDGCVLLTLGNSDWRRFKPSATPNAYTSPTGDFSDLRFNPATGKWTRSYDNGAFDTYDSQGKLLTRSDRYGRSTIHSYSGSLLSSKMLPTLMEKRSRQSAHLNVCLSLNV